MSFFPLPKYNKYDMKFLGECAKRRGMNAAVVVSYGENDECDQDELKRDFQKK